MHALFLPLLALCATSAASAQTVHVVDDDGGPGVAFTDLSAAVIAAAAGDVLLVKEGTYAGFTLAGKGLVISADTGANVRCTSPFAVQGVPAGARVVLRGLAFDPSPLPCRVEACAGWVGLQDCALEGSRLEVEQAVVVATGCAIQAGGAGAPGVRVAAGQLQLWQSSVRGADGMDGIGGAGSAGGTGVEIVAATLFASGSSVTGGDGGAGGSGASCGDGGDGGAGLVADGLSLAWLQDVTAAGGHGGPPSGAPCVAGADGAATLGPTAPIAGFGHVLVVETPVRMGTPAANLLVGAPGDLAVIAIALHPGAVVFPPWHGALAIAPPSLVLAVGVVPPSGVLTLLVPVPVLAGIEAVQLYEQAAFLGPSGAITLSSPSFPLVLAPFL